MKRKRAAWRSSRKVGVERVVTPMKPTRTPARSTISYGGRSSSAVPVDGVGRDVGEVRTRELGRRGVHELSRHVRLERLGPRAPAALEQPHQLVAALVELVVAHRADVEADLVRGLDGRLVVEPARDERRGADHVAGMHANGAVGQGRAVEMGLQPGGSSDARPRRLQVAVEVVHAQQAQLHDAASQLLLTRLRSTRLGVETEQGDEHGGDEGGQPGQQSRHGSDAKCLQIAGCYALCAVA